MLEIAGGILIAVAALAFLPYVLAVGAIALCALLAVVALVLALLLGSAFIEWVGAVTVNDVVASIKLFSGVFGLLAVTFSYAWVPMAWHGIKGAPRSAPQP